MAIDIVCGKQVSEAAVNAETGRVAGGAPETDPAAGTKRFYNGRWYYFCSLACRHRFVATPDEFIVKST
ncbi:MAG TPA: YHS domain-containing protein [Tepidiformaceae bacterium]|nr:YHS domain-containing protein [Tepidiformaceae bacterium]HMO95700.1 YHS domain-containing protein [Tepidiformaceae bacterium]